MYQIKTITITQYNNIIPNNTINNNTTQYHTITIQSPHTITIIIITITQ